MPRPVHLFVTEPADGTVTDTAAPTNQINCGVGGDDCGQIYTSIVTCNPDGDCTSDGPLETLVASGFPLPGYTARFFACTSNAAGTTACTAGAPCDNGAGGCTLEMNQSWRVRLEWVDTTAPTKPSISGPAKVGPAVHHFAGAGATDNTGVSDYRYLLDGVDQGVSATGYDVDAGSLSAGTHHLAARARDAAGNESDVSDDFAFTVDRSAAVSITSPAAGGHFKAAPTFSFTHDGDVGEIVCQTLDAGSAVVHESPCSSSYTPVPGGDGDYSARVVFTDDVGNQATATRAFKLDTGDPNVVITSPTDGRHVKSPFTPAFTATRRRHGRRQPRQGVQAGDGRGLRRLRRAQRGRRPAHALGPRDRRGGQRARRDRRLRRRLDGAAGRHHLRPSGRRDHHQPRRELRAGRRATRRGRSRRPAGSTAAARRRAPPRRRSPASRRAATRSRWR